MNLPEPPRSPAAKLAVAGLCVALLALVGVLDRLTGWELSFSLFYLVPVGLAAVALGRTAGLGAAVVGAFLWWAVDSLSGVGYRSPSVGYWNAFVRLGFFVIVAWTLAALVRAMRELQNMATTDPLTGSLNRRALYTEMSREIARCRRYGHCLSVAVLDVDGFKAVNDEEGHARGDGLLRRIAEVLRSELRATDSSARLGGDEFAVLLPEADAAAATATCEKLREKLRAAANGGGWGVTFSIGVVSFDEAHANADLMLRQADELLYEAKAAGKNRVVQGSGRPSTHPVPRSPRAAAPGPQ